MRADGPVPRLDRIIASGTGGKLVFITSRTYTCQSLPMHIVINARLAPKDGFVIVIIGFARRCAVGAQIWLLPARQVVALFALVLDITGDATRLGAFVAAVNGLRATKFFAPATFDAVRAGTP